MKKRIISSVALSVVLIATICIGIITNKNAKTVTDNNEEHEFTEADWSEVLLCGEAHNSEKCLEAELELWGELYAQGARHLFMEDGYSATAFLNEWMKADNDEILDDLYDDWIGTQMHSINYLNFYHRIKEEFPETVFHGTDIDHLYYRTGQRYLEKIISEGKKGSREYNDAVRNYQQGEKYYQMMISALNADAADNYRELCMAQNFIREYERLRNEKIMGIYGAAHTDPGAIAWGGTVDCMAKQLYKKYGAKITTIDVSEDYIMKSH